MGLPLVGVDADAVDRVAGLGRGGDLLQRAVAGDAAGAEDHVHVVGGGQQRGDHAVARVQAGVLVPAGQVLLVPVEALLRRGDQIGVGAPSRKGGDVAGGRAIENNTGGYFYAPTILADVTPAMGAAQNEIFGPVISVLRYATFEQALEIANGVEFGLTSALFSETPTVVERFVAQSQSGMMHVNHGTVPDNHMPFVGIKASGVGNGSVGASAVNFYTTAHSVYRKASGA